MKKVHITRKNWIAISMVFLYCLLFVCIAGCLDAKNSIFSSKNPIHMMAESLLGSKNMINAEFNAWIMIYLFAIYAFVFAAAFIFEMRMAKFYDNKIHTRKWVITYVVTGLLCAALWLGISLVCQLPIGTDSVTFASNLTLSFKFLGEVLLFTLIIGIFVAAFIFSICAIFINFRNIDKPYRFFKPEEYDDFEEQRDEEVEKKREEQGELSDILGVDLPKINTNCVSSNNAGVNGSTNEVSLGTKEYVFPGLCSIDKESLDTISAQNIPENGISLKDMADRFRNYLAKQEGLYFDIRTIRSFLAGLSVSRLIILEGLSGTGKSSIARYFSTFIGEDSFFAPVQASWRDRTSLLGYYNDFSKRYNETPFIQRLYKMTYQSNHVNIMVLDEINIARVEYYFADFLSILEYPKDKWILHIMQLPYGFEAPEHLINGELHIPENTWFIGTANKDDSTYTITDKVYDRAITISFDGRNEPFAVDGDADPIMISYDDLSKKFDTAKSTVENRMSEDDYKKFSTITDFVNDTFDITFGNRILNQIDDFVPVFVALGGTKEEALDFLFSRKVISKLDGRFEDYVKEGLSSLLSLIDDTYGVNSFMLTRSEVKKFMRKL